VAHVHLRSKGYRPGTHTRTTHLDGISTYRLRVDVLRIPLVGVCVDFETHLLIESNNTWEIHVVLFGVLLNVIHSRCRVSLLMGLGFLILKDFHAWEPLKSCFIEYAFAVIKTPREPHFPSRNQRYVLDSTRLPFYLLPLCFALITTALP
jgi:hypothetical protein